MFDIGSWEIVLVLIVALIVIGPRQLPTVAYNVGLWLRYLRNLLRGLQHEVKQVDQRSLDDKE